METFKCLTHSKNATAYCRTHKMVLCTNCLINNVHKDAECQLNEIEAALDEDKIHLQLLKLEQSIKMKEEQKKIEQNGLIKLNTDMGNEIEDCFAKVVECLNEKKMNTLDGLKRAIDRRNTGHERDMDALIGIQSKVTKIKEELNNRTTSSYDNTLSKIRTELRKLNNEIEQIPTEMLKTGDCKFIQFSNQTIFSESTDVLGDIEFADEIYANPDDLPQTQDQLPKTVKPGPTTRFPDPKIEETMQTTLIDGSDYYAKLPQAPPFLKIACEDNILSSCVFEKLDAVTDNRLLVLDSRHQKILLVDLDSTILNEFTEDGENVKMVNWCILKKDKVAILAVDDNRVFISQVSIIKDTMKSKSKVSLGGDLKMKDGFFKGFDFHAGTLQTVFAVAQLDRVTKFQKGKVIGSSIIAPEHVGDPHEVEMIYDFREDAVFILNKTLECLTSYNCKTNKVNWTVKSSKEPVNFEFHPLAMYRSRFLQVLCVDKVLRVCTSTGTILQTNANIFDKNLTAFCVCGNDIIASTGTNRGSSKEMKLIVYKDVVVVDKQ